MTLLAEKFGFFKQCLALLALCYCFFPTSIQAEEASLNGAVLSIPVVVVGEIFYSVELTIVADSNPIEFELTGAAEIFDATPVGATTFSGITLSIPSITVDGTSYWVALVLLSEDPIKFGLADFGVVDNSAQQEAEAFSLFESTISPDLVQAKCIACHTAGGLARDANLQFVNPNIASVQNNFEAFRHLLQLQANGVDYVLSKVLGNVHGGGVQLTEGSQSYEALETFLTLLNSTIAPTNAESGFFAGITLQSNAATLRRASIILAGQDI